MSRLTIQDVVKMYGISWNTVCEIDLARLKKLARLKLGGLKRLAIDENYLGRRLGYITMVLDLDTMAIVSVLKGARESRLWPRSFLSCNRLGPRSKLWPPTCPAVTSQLSWSICRRPRWCSIWI